MALDEGAYKTLSLLELTGPAPLTATHKRSVATLTWLVDQGFVETYGSSYEGTMQITDEGRAALARHREEKVEEQVSGDFEVRTAEDVTPRVLEYVQDIITGYFPTGIIDWEEVWERLERRTVDGDRSILMTRDANSPAVQKIQREIRKWQAQG
jgi:DNA-binding MarR family transcriptional regulator